MKLLVSAGLALAVLVPISDVLAAPDQIDDSVAALSGAERVDNATRTETPVPPAPTPTVPTEKASTVPNEKAPAASNEKTPAASTKKAPSGVSAEMQQVLDLVNVERTARGLAALTFNVHLNTVALAHTHRQASDGSIYHQDPSDGSSPGDRVSRTGYRSSTWGENVAAGYQTADSVMRGWMTSPGHCKNLLNPEFTEIGVGFVAGGARYGEFWTQVFARPGDVPRPAGTYDPAWC